jgi:hypothetical protein
VTTKLLVEIGGLVCLLVVGWTWLLWHLSK